LFSLGKQLARSRTLILHEHLSPPTIFPFEKLQLIHHFARMPTKKPQAPEAE
jgi:hypothetical protein